MAKQGSRHTCPGGDFRRPGDGRVPLLVAAVLVCLFVPGTVMSLAGDRVTSVAVFPVENLTDDLIPADIVRHFVVDTLRTEGVSVLDDSTLESFMARHRVRYTAGIDATTAALLREETGVNGVVFVTFELSSTVVPPKVALIVRLVEIADTPVVAWAHDVGASGNDAPGLFGLGLVTDYGVLLDQTFERIRKSLVTYLTTGHVTIGPRHASTFRPRSAYRRLDFEPHRTYSIAVVPFFNLSQRRNAGDIIKLLFVRHLSLFDHFRVLDTGLPRRQLLNARIIMDDGLSVTDAETVADLIDADFVLAGRVMRYDDFEGAEGLASVEFSTVLIERETRRVVWSSHSYNEGTDGMSVFGRGQSRTAHVMATQMVGLTAESIAGHDR